MKIEINNEEDRRQLTSILAENGYSVRVEKTEHYTNGDRYFVIIKLDKKFENN